MRPHSYIVLLACMCAVCPGRSEFVAGNVCEFHFVFRPHSYKACVLSVQDKESLWPGMSPCSKSLICTPLLYVYFNFMTLLQATLLYRDQFFQLVCCLSRTSRVCGLECVHIASCFVPHITGLHYYT